MRFFKRNSSKEQRPSNREELNSKQVDSSVLSEDGADSTRFAHGLGSGMLALSQEDESSSVALNQAFSSLGQGKSELTSQMDEGVLKQRAFMPFVADRPFQYQASESDNAEPQFKYIKTDSVHKDASLQAENAFGFSPAQDVTQPFSYQDSPDSQEDRPFIYQETPALQVEERPFSYQSSPVDAAMSTNSRESANRSVLDESQQRAMQSLMQESMPGIKQNVQLQADGRNWASQIGLSADSDETFSFIASVTPSNLSNTQAESTNGSATSASVAAKNLSANSDIASSASAFDVSSSASTFAASPSVSTLAVSPSANHAAKADSAYLAVYEDKEAQDKATGKESKFNQHIEPEFSTLEAKQSKVELEQNFPVFQQDNVLSSEQAESSLDNLGGSFTAQDNMLDEQANGATLQEGILNAQDEHEQAIQLVAKMMLGSPLANLTADTNDELEQGADFALSHTVQEMADNSLVGLNTKAAAFSAAQEEGDLNLSQALSAAEDEQDLVLLDENILADKTLLNAQGSAFNESQAGEMHNANDLVSESLTALLSNTDLSTVESSNAVTASDEASNMDSSNADALSAHMQADADGQDNACSQNEEFLVNRHLFEPKHKIELVSEREGEEAGPRVTFLDAESEHQAVLAEQREDAILQAFVGPIVPNAPQSRTPSFMLLNTHANITLQELREQEQEEHLLSKEQKKQGNEADIHDFITGNIVSLSTGTDNVAVPIASGGADAGIEFEDDVDLTQDQVQGDRIEIKSLLDDDANYASTISSFTGNIFSPKLLPTLAHDIGRYFYVYALAIVFGVLCLMKVYQVQDTRNLTSQLNEVTVNNEGLEKEWLNLLATRQNLSEHSKVRSYATFQLNMVSPKTESEQVISLH